MSELDIALLIKAEDKLLGKIHVKSIAGARSKPPIELYLDHEISRLF